ncbi:DUF3221 domain-containing protein [Bacillus sp. CLL-7-23]|uniref:DUF3221 domain-containing protein n=1 Tax=Bacillus changyiensis TaxID=3004103 RepID=A0ABT4X814_9BACI|nr:DUF3221 domain-containing protein [Bacillus changyiensis]MDA7027487.1 DUF3221 domain-containing protein [Bacillus changyiensis]
MHKLLFLLSVIAILVLTECQSREDHKEGQSIVGYIMFKQGDRAILVESQNNPKKEHYHLTKKELLEKYKNKVILLGISEIKNKENMKKRQKVKVWFQVLKESTPPQAKIYKFKKLQQYS